MINELVQRVYTDRVLSHLAHWKTNSYARHMALGSFYEDVIEPLDDFIEDYQAAFGLIDTTTFPSFKTPTDDALGTLKENVKWISKNRDKLCKGVTSLENILDSISDTYLKAIYKIENLK